MEFVKLCDDLWPDRSRSRHCEKDPLNQTIFGVLVDVSGSMETAFALDSSKDASVERVHAIITTTLKIVKAEVNHHNRSDEIFVTAFGLDSRIDTCDVDTCDLIALLHLIAGPKKLRALEPHDALVELAKEHGAAHAERWIRKHLNKKDARDLYRVFCFDNTLVAEMVHRIPADSVSSKTASGAGIILSLFVPGGSFVEGVAVHRTEAYCYAQELVRRKDEIIKRKLVSIEHSSPESVLRVSQLLDDLNLRDNSSGASNSSSLHSQIKELIDPIRPYIFGGTPMCKAIRRASQVFHFSGAKFKVLLILSDGESADGNPCIIARDLKDSNIIIVSCYLTDAHIPDPRCLMDRASPDWPESDGRRTLFDISSTVRNIDPPVSFLVDFGWKLPPSGESRLFVQANSLDVVDELCKIVVAELTNPCDALVDILQKVPLGQYIHQENASFKPEEQVGSTCYAHAVATVFHLAMHRIVGRDGKYPEFKQIKDRLIDEYDKVKIPTREILAKVGPEYRLHSKEVDEIRARQALNHRRPLVARFFLRKNQWAKFSEFYKKTPKGVLQRANVGDGSTVKEKGDGGHAVVLIRCSPDYLLFMNSWGQTWGDGGFFRVKDADVLDGMTFFDVYWTLNDLKQTEKDAYQIEAIKAAKNLSATFPSINSLPFECPQCRKTSSVNEFEGDLIEANCPKCEHKFRPTTDDLVKSLYLKNV